MVKNWDPEPVVTQQRLDFCIRKLQRRPRSRELPCVCCRIRSRRTLCGVLPDRKNQINEVTKRSKSSHPLAQSRNPVEVTFEFSRRDPSTALGMTIRLTRPLHQREDMCFFGGIIEGPKFADLIKPPHTVESIEIPGVAGSEFASFEIAAAQIFIAESLGTLPAEKMKTQPAAIGTRNALGFAKESDEQEENKIGINLRLELQIPGKFFGGDPALAVFKLERGVESVIQFLNKNNEGANVGIAQAAPGIVAFELVNEPARIIDPDIELVAGVTEESTRDLIQFAGRGASQFAEMNGTGPINDAIFKVNPDLSVGTFEQALDLAEERFVHTNDGRSPSSKLSRRSAS
jgi:hypothetical protein